MNKTRIIVCEKAEFLIYFFVTRLIQYTVYIESCTDFFIFFSPKRVSYSTQKRR